MSKTQVATVRMKIYLEPLPVDDSSLGRLHKKPNASLLAKLDKQLGVTKSRAWKILNGIWFPKYYGTIATRRHAGKLLVEITTILKPIQYKGVFWDGTPSTIANMEKAIRKYINNDGPDTWMGSDITWEKKYELVPRITYVKIKENNGKSRKSRKSKRKSRKSRKSKRKSRKSRKSKRKSRKARKSKRKA